ncbi:MAG: DUF996 domain-containing protein [Bacteroidota bacterium]|nr:DUF996 domain-containing protein [Bacteroidota bacterium]
MKKQAVNLGRIGILLPIAAIIPYLGNLAGLGALILLLISFHNFSKFYETPAIFNKALVGFILPIAGSIVGGIILAITAASAVFSVASAGESSFNVEVLSKVFAKSSVSISVAAIIMLASSVIGLYFLLKSMKMLTEKSGIKHFKTAGSLYYIGMIVTTIIFVVIMVLFFIPSVDMSPFLAFLLLIGSIIMLVGWIFHIIAYFTIKTDEELPEK